MSEFWLRAVTRVVRAWTRLYTSGTPTDVRDRRLAEIESDLWESRQPPHSAWLPAQVLLRLVLGVRDDLAWRRSCRSPSRIAQAAIFVALTAMTLVAGLFFTLARAAVLPAPPPLAQHVRVVPPPPPPPPPPCAPPGTGRPSPSPCVR